MAKILAWGSCPLSTELLEDRCTPTAYLVNGVLTVFGTGGNDLIQVSQIENQLSVGAYVYDAVAVQYVVIDAGDGHDTISISPDVRAEVWAFGRGGDDRLVGGGGRSHLYGGSGNDTLIAGTAADVLDGGSGTNFVTTHAGQIPLGSQLTQTASMGVVGQAIGQLINQERIAVGLPSLEINGQLIAASEIHSRNMASMVRVYGYAGAMNHVLLGSLAPTLGVRADLVGYDYRLLAENLAFGYLTPQAVVQAWMDSPGHRANLLNPNFTQFGVGVAWTTDGLPYYTLMLGTPMPVTQAVTVPVSSTTTATSSPPAPPPVGTATAVTSPTPTAGDRGQTTPATSPVPATSTAAIRGRVVTAADRGNAPWVTIVDAASGRVQQQFLAYDRNFRGGVRVAVADVTGDGIADIITVPGPGMSSWVKVFDGFQGREVLSFLAFHPRWTGGVYVAAGDVTGDGRADIVVSSDAPSGGLVRVIDGRTLGTVQTFYAYGGTRWGSRIWVSDMNGDGRADIVTAPVTPSIAEIRIFDGVSGALMGQFSSGGPASRLAVGDVSGDGRGEIIISDPANSTLRVVGMDGRERGRISITGMAPSRLAIRDVNADGSAEIMIWNTAPTGQRRILLISGSGSPRSEFATTSLVDGFLA